VLHLGNQRRSALFDPRSIETVRIIEGEA